MLWALNCVRSGDIEGAGFLLNDIPRAEDSVYARLQVKSRHAEYLLHHTYSYDRAKFKKNLLALAKELKEIGL